MRGAEVCKDVEKERIKGDLCHVHDRLAAADTGRFFGLLESLMALLSTDRRVISRVVREVPYVYRTVASPLGYGLVRCHVKASST